MEPSDELCKQRPVFYVKMNLCTDAERRPVSHSRHQNNLMASTFRSSVLCKSITSRIAEVHSAWPSTPRWICRAAGGPNALLGQSVAQRSDQRGGFNQFKGGGKSLD